MQSIGKDHWIYRLLIILLGVSFLVPLVSYAFIGSFMRYSGDDYCYGAVVRRHGFWRAQVYSYTENTPYHGNRYSLTLVSGFASLFPPKVNGVLPGLALFLIVLGLTYLLVRGSSLMRFPLRWLEALLLSEFVIFLTLYMAPELSQSLYWRSGMLPYFAPLVTGTCVGGLILRQMGGVTPL